MYIGHGGSIVFHSEIQVRYTMQAIAHMLRGSVQSLEVKQAVYDEYQVKANDVLDTTVWGDAGCTSWYKTPSGKIVNNSPWMFKDYWYMTRHLKEDDYESVKAKGSVQARL